MTQQLNIFSGASLKEKGMKHALANANRVETGWSERAYALLLQFLSALPKDRRFMTETFRLYAFDHGLPSPPSLRAFGSIAMRAAREGKIVRMGYGTVTNIKAHRCFASVWRKV